MPDVNDGRILTFYSYKGGTGRTMALANVACLLADAGDEVLVVDWDLEAPGLHRFFQPRLRVPSGGSDIGLDDTPGLIDLFISLGAALPATLASSEDASEEAVAAVFATLRLEDYVRETTVPGVLIMRAGRNDDGEYSRRVGTFDWEGLFKRAPGVYQAFAARLSARYRYVLVDSRTGVTDISGICTYLLPEQLVVVFTPNRQSLTGVRELVERATKYRRGSDDLRPLLVYPLPSRIEASLQDLRARWRFGDPDRDVIGYQPMFQDLLKAAYGLERCDLSAYFDEVQIQQTPDYAYGEEIAVRRTGDRFSMANSYVVFTKRLTSGEPPWAAPAAEAPPMAEAVTLGSPGAKAPAPASVARKPLPVEATPATGSASGPQVFLSYAHQDRERVRMVASELEARGLRVWHDEAIVAGSDFSQSVSRALDASEAVVVFWSRDSVESRWVRAEAEEGLRRGVLVPVLLDDVAPPLTFRSVLSADLRRPTSDGFEKLADAVARVAVATPGTVMTPAPVAASPPAARRWMLALAAAAVVVIGVAVALTQMMSTAGTSADPAVAPATPVQMVTVPDFIGAASADASKTADLIGLELVMMDLRGTQGTYLEGVVTKQLPAAGSSVERLAKVQLQIATQTVSVPTLVGNTLNFALTSLDKSGLRLGTASSNFVDDAKPGTIVSQTPEAGKSVPAGTAVDVLVASAVRPTPRRGP